MLHCASLDDIRERRVTDVYFARTREILERKGTSKHVVAEIHCSSLPGDWTWGVLCGVEEVAAALEGMPVDVHCAREGSLFLGGEPVLRISGDYVTFAEMETALLGLLCQSSGIASRASRVRVAAGDRSVISFGARRAHPAIAPMIGRACYVGGCDGESVILSAEAIGLEPSGTMPHALILIAGDLATALRWYDEVIDESVPRVALVDTFCDEKFEALEAAETLGRRLDALRLDTPASRRGDWLALMREVRWELDLRGHEHVKLFLSGGLDEHSIRRYNEFASGYGVGTSLSGAPPINFGMDIVEIEGKPFTKRGKLSGVKNVAICPACGTRSLMPQSQQVSDTCGCGERTQMLLQPLLEQGEIVADLSSVDAVRKRSLQQVRAWTGAHPEAVNF
ncbi:MAG: nicotinate phosphoribosyltransferase [candidate division WS1 bacterium]|jgi:nicotinate phosphoribosyltransferase|nr:nicotinate phosphoribosyltransferase [candidate division WS1 bacterium]